MAYPDEVRFEWDPAKDDANRRTHGISFEEASELFVSGANYLEIFDEAHSDDEELFIAIARCRGLVVVIWTARDADAIRIISARRATARETQLSRVHMGDKS